MTDHVIVVPSARASGFETLIARWRAKQKAKRGRVPGKLRTAKSRSKARHEARGDVLVAFWAPRWLRRKIVDRLEWAKASEIDDGDELGKGILEELIRLARKL